ncbi:hypothetical protein DI270_030305 [Microbispora triticiradicis]|nr:hypothetical protein DI270_030305 [Microbispora triticiradicis]GLW20274.1 hypothetical protein Mame01_03170 [Microbispora amethystogenes]
MPSAHALPGELCRVAFTITTGLDGLRDDSSESIRLGDRPTGPFFLFEDADGDGTPDPEPLRQFHVGGTGDSPHATFTWNAVLSPCLPVSALQDGFVFHHISDAPDFSADNWDLAALRVVDRDTGTVLIDRAAPPGRFLHRFRKNADQTFSTMDLDSDGDGLTDRVELKGITHADGTVDTWLPDHGADPCRGTIAIELDWLDDGTDAGDDRPDGAAIQETVAMFDAAARPAQPTCPYAETPRPGVQLLVDVDDAIAVTPEQRRQPLNIERGGQIPFLRFREADFTPGRANLFHYNLWGYQHDDSSSSGWCCHGPDFMVTLGTWSGGAPVRVQSGTLAHELGHALGLSHGGADNVNYKPNYLSVMNYNYQFIGVPDVSEWRGRIEAIGPATDFGTRLNQALDQVSRLDYSRAVLPPLDRRHLDEHTGIGTGTDSMAAWWDNEGDLRVGDGSAGLDWDADFVVDAEPVAVDVNGAFQQCVVGTDPDRTPPANDDLQTTPSPGTDDLSRYGLIYAGLNGRCETPASPEDTAKTAIGYDYPVEYGYDDALDGADDWARIGFRIGVSPDAGQALPPPASEPGTEEIKRQRARVVDALVAASGPVPGATPRWGYAYMDRATTTEAPIGVETALNPYWQWSTGRLDPATAGRRATVVHTGTGEYEVRLPGIASQAGIAHVTAYRTVYRGRTCAVAGYAPDGPDELIRVRCFNEAGAAVDWWFTIFFAAPGAGTRPYATVQYDDGAGGTATVDPVHNGGTVNAGGGVNRVLRESTGRYRVILEGAPFAAGTGYVQVTPYGHGRATRCNPLDTTPGAGRVEIVVGCYAIGGSATAQPADSPWLLSYVDGAGLHRDAGTPAAYVSVSGDPADPVVDTAHSFSGNGEVPTVSRLGVGYYRLTWNTLGKTGDNVQVTAIGSEGGYCHLGTIDSYSAPPRLSVYVWCHTANGIRGDSRFGVAYVRAP